MAIEHNRKPGDVLRNTRSNTDALGLQAAGTLSPTPNFGPQRKKRKKRMEGLKLFEQGLSLVAGQTPLRVANHQNTPVRQAHLPHGRADSFPLQAKLNGAHWPSETTHHPKVDQSHEVHEPCTTSINHRIFLCSPISLPDLSPSVRSNSISGRLSFSANSN